MRCIDFVKNATKDMNKELCLQKAPTHILKMMFIMYSILLCSLSLVYL